MLECITHKITVRHDRKYKEASEKWTGLICPKIRKKLDKNAQYSGNYFRHIQDFESMVLNQETTIILWIFQPEHVTANDFI